MSSQEPDTRTRILEAAKGRLRKHGTAVRLEDVAREAGVSRQAVYLHFGSRTRLFEALVEHIDVAGRTGELERRIRTAPDAVSALDAVVDQRARYIPDIQPVVQALLEDRRRDPAAGVAYESRREARRRDYTLLVKRLEDEGRLAPGWRTESAVDAISVLLSIPTWEQLTLESGWSRARYARHLKAILHRAFVRER